MSCGHLQTILSFCRLRSCRGEAGGVWVWLNVSANFYFQFGGVILSTWWWLINGRGSMELITTL